MINIYTIMVSLYFGLYTIVDVFTVGVGNAAPESALLAIGPIVLTTVIAWLIYAAFPSNLKSELQLKSLMYRWVQADPKGVMFAAIMAIAFQGYVFATYGVVTYVYVDDLDKVGISIPSWIAPAKELSNSLAFCAILYYLTKLLLGERRGWLDSLLLMLTVVIIGLLGRRAIINIGLIGLLIWMAAKKRSVGFISSIGLLVTAVTVFIFFSNIYQSYRHDLSFQASREEAEVLGLMDAATNFESTIGNLSDRIAMWRFNEMIISKQLNNPLNVLWGQLTWQALLNSIPGAVWQKKDIIDIDEMIAARYGFEFTDYPTSNFSTLQADYGFGMIIFAPGLILILLAMTGIAKLAMTDRPFLFLMISGFVLQYIMNVENSLGDIFILCRNIFAITVICLVCEVLTLAGSWLFCWPIYRTTIKQQPVNL
jgi:hypothetical protein